jgi:hypothetical protein
MELPVGSENEILSPAVARARLSDLDAQISALEISLRDLRLQRKVVKDHLAAYKYPVVTAPTEIVSEIFSHFLPAYPELPPLIGRNSTFTLAQICRRWRKIALSTPLLWRAISIDLGGEIPDAIQLYRLGNWLERSGRQPFSLSLNSSGDSTINSPVIEAIVQHLHLCEEMQLQLPYMSELVLFQFKDMPLLHTLTLGPGEPDTQESMVVFERAPKLTTVTVEPDFDPFRIILPWSQITTLHVIHLIEENLTEILRLAVNLVSCSASLQGSDPDALSTLPPHTHLQDLTLRPVYLPFSIPNAPVLEQLILPALRRLEIPEHWFAPSPCTRIAAWISRAAGDLEELHITHCETSEYAYRKALPSVPKISVRFLKLDVDESDEENDSDW